MRRKMKRAVHFDFHNLPALPDLGDDFSAEAYVKTLRDAKVKYINFFARCNLGYSYYPTKVGCPHPYLKGRDILGDIIKECHKYDIGVTAYLNGGINHEFAYRHRDWTVVDSDGRVLYGDRTGHGFRNMCYDTGYGDHLVAEVQEVLSMYPDVDGIFIDCFSFADACYGSECIERMKAEGIDIENKDQVNRYHAKKQLRMAKRLRDAVPEDKYFFINGSLNNGTLYVGRTENDTHSEIECLATGGWGYECFPWKVAYERNIYDDVVFMTGRFHASWGDFGGLREKAGFEYDAYMALANAVNISIGDHLPPRGLPEKAVYDIVKEVYTDIEATEPWTDDAKYVPEIGVLINKGDWSAYYETETYPLYKAMSATQGVCRMLGELKYQYDVITADLDLSKFRLLIIPDYITFGEEEAKAVDAYLKNGGKVISSGISGLTPDLSGFALDRWNFYYKGKEKWNVSYFKAKEEIAQNIPDMVTATYKTGIAMSEKDGNKILADYWEPYFGKHWDGHQGYYYTPYSKKSEDFDAILRQDEVIHIGFSIFEAYNVHQYPVHQKIVANCIKLLLSDKKIESNLPTFARATLTEKENLMLFHVISYCPESKSGLGIINEGIKLYENTFSIESEKEPKKLYTVPDRKEIPFKYENGRVNFDVFKIDSHAIFAMEF